MGKLNVPKMANFMEIDVFVLVACPENTLIDSQVSKLKLNASYYFQHRVQSQLFIVMVQFTFVTANAY
jgi:diphthamide synthase subunit DPH2